MGSVAIVSMCVCVYGYVCSIHFDFANVFHYTRRACLRQALFGGLASGVTLEGGSRTKLFPAFILLLGSATISLLRIRRQRSHCWFSTKEVKRGISMTGPVMSLIRRQMGFSLSPEES
ncbi:uncharacterized protein LY79DRAFT_174949 [Colletotrichum navitas]|uniref:Transmembrane protein n=1 Tax=Colletotrichum navitas TaxID=681940 RepID=A0AAD8Q1B5_9PEZI|nr:uncharacterized protein LY79DRAFT_174949 [Colletotrichum navitas]KAK1593620.1 hypothetical protein LY79DRAFT_174949 [Colletotrichum navitas]